MSTDHWTEKDDPRLIEAFSFRLRAGCHHQDGGETAAPSIIFADADYSAGDGSCGLHEDDKCANEPAIVYVRSDAYLAATDEIRRLREAITSAYEDLIESDDSGAFATLCAAAEKFPEAQP